MATQKLLLSFLLFSLLAGHKAVHGSSHHHHHHHRHDAHSSDRPEEHKYTLKPTKLFVFGDSYADTGNNKKWEARSWKVPYGMTFPSFPAGRFSDGLVFTDFLARFLGVKSPLPIEWWKEAIGPHLRFGTNFAYGGTGVFNTLSSDPNMTVQIDCFERLTRVSFFKAAVTHTSVALLTNSGNDYDAYQGEDILGFIDKVVNQLVVNMKRVYSLGVRKIAIATLPPLGCLPEFTSAMSFQTCNETVNFMVGFHNGALQLAMDKLNNETSPSTFVTVDISRAIYWVIKNSTIFKNPYKPCCMGVSSEYMCGNVDANGMKKYTVCKDPSAHFFWDMVHPTEAGWRAVTSALGKKLDRLY